MADNYRPPTAPDQPQAAPTPYKAPSKSKRYRPPTAPDQPQVVTTPTEKKKVVGDYRPPVAPGEVPQVITRPTAPREVTALSTKVFGAVDARLTQQSQRLAAERERAATGAALVAEARARKPTEPAPYIGTEYIPSPYKPGTRPEDVEYGERPTFEQPQITDIHEVIGSIIDVSAGKFKAGTDIVEGKEVDIDVVKVEEPEKYVTRNIFDYITEKTADYRRAIESEEAQRAIRVGIKAPTFLLPTPEIGERDPAVRFVTGVLESPAMIPDVAASLMLGAEHAVRTKGEVYKDLPLAAGVMIGGMKHEVASDPFKFAGEMAGLPLFAKYVPTPSVPSAIKTKVPLDLLFKERLKPPTGLTAEQALKFEAGAEIATAFKHVEPPIMESLKFADIKALRGKSPEIVEAWIRAHPEQETVIAGSTAAKAQFRGARKPGDVDLYVKDVTKAGEELYTSLSRELPSGETKLTRQPEHGAAIVEIKDPATGLYHHAVDIHQIPPAGSQLRFGMETQAPVKIEGIRYVRAGELVQRKAESILQKQSAGKIGPKSHRGKDIADFISLTEELIAKRHKDAEASILFKGKKTKKAEALEEQLGIYKMYSTPSYELMADTMTWYSKLGLPTKVVISAVGVGVAGLYKKEAYPNEDKVKTTPYVPPSIPDIQRAHYIPPVIQDTKTPPYLPPEVPDKKPYPYLPPEVPDKKPYPYLPPEIPELLPTPPPPKRLRLDLDKKPKKPVGRVKKETPGYAWQLANPIATLEQLMGGKRTTKRTNRAAPRKSKSRRKTIKW